MVELDSCYVNMPVRLGVTIILSDSEEMVVEVTLMWLNPSDGNIRVWRWATGHKSTSYEMESHIPVNVLFVGIQFLLDNSHELATLGILDRICTVRINLGYLVKRISCFIRTIREFS